MSYFWFAFILVVGTGLTLALAVFKLWRRFFHGIRLARLPWLAVLAPFFLAMTVIAVPWIELVLLWHGIDLRAGLRALS